MKAKLSIPQELRRMGIGQTDVPRAKWKLGQRVAYMHGSMVGPRRGTIIYVADTDGGEGGVEYGVQGFDVLLWEAEVIGVA